ncbi:MAG TPA: tyrosine-type recombinase/integrase [Verrucomicrobiae bacterium]|nr:tyrosine-type recombinase/integrase [Verrucomicrobiae bacterium]
MKVPLVDSTGANLATVSQAVAALNALRLKRDDDTLPPLQKTCTLAEYIGRYTQWLDDNKPKSELTIIKEKSHLAVWARRTGSIPLAFLQPHHIDEFVKRRRQDKNKKTGQPLSNRTINLDIIALNNCLNRAMKIDKMISKLPTQHWESLDHTAPRRPLWTKEQIELVCQKALEREKTKQETEKRAGCGQMVVDYIRFLCFSGSRRTAALQVKWSDVDFQNRRVWFERGVKYGQPYCFEFNDRLESLLKEMHARRQPDSEHLFPSPRSGKDERGNRIDAPVLTLQNVFYDARKAAGFPDMRFHDFRHYFISECVMAGIEYMTIAKWVNHKDGGILIGKVYGHLNDAHRRKQAEKVFKRETPSAAASDPVVLQDLLQKTLAQLAQFQQQKGTMP